MVAVAVDGSIGDLLERMDDYLDRGFIPGSDVLALPPRRAVVNQLAHVRADLYRQHRDDWLDSDTYQYRLALLANVAGECLA